MDGSVVNGMVAFVAGVSTFFASCLLPLVPTYLAYLSGVSLSDKEASKKKYSVVKTAALFVTGFVLTFVLMSLFVSQLTTLFSPFRAAVEKIGGLIFIILGLSMLGIFEHPLFSSEHRIDIKQLLFGQPKIQKLFTKFQSLHAVVLGMAFGFGWTPCIGPVLAVILFWANRSGTAAQGVFLLILFGLGLGLPFMLIALGFEKLVPLLKKYAQISRYIGIISGTLILLVGLLLLLNYFDIASRFLLQLFGLSSLTL